MTNIIDFTDTRALRRPDYEATHLAATRALKASEGYLSADDLAQAIEQHARAGELLAALEGLPIPV